MRVWALGVSSDQGVEGEDGGVGVLVEGPSGIIEKVGVFESNGGDELGMEERVVEEASDEELGVDLVDLSEACAG